MFPRVRENAGGRPLTHIHVLQEVLGRKSRDATCMPLSSQVWFQGTRGWVALEASCYADPHNSPKRITGFAALSAHPDGIQGSFDSPEQAFQLLCHPPNLPDLNLLLPSREESWRVDTFKFHILPRLINSLSRPFRIQSCMEQRRSWCMVPQQSTSCVLQVSYKSWVKPACSNTCQ